jgi:hypothetical protein
VTPLLDPEETLVPSAFVAVTVNVYVTPFVRPVTVAVVVALFAVAPPGLAVTVYEVIAEPPLLAGADQDTSTLVSPIVPATFVGASGTVAGVTELLATDEELVPRAFVAVTVNV